MRSRGFITAAALLGVAATGAATGAGADDLAAGQALFVRSCATCHGASAAGDGPMRPLLSVRVPDLRVLSAGAGGDFPLRRVIAIVDGRDALPGHGGPMPIFSHVLDGGSVVIDGPDGSPIATRADILAIVRWLESIQN